MNTAQLSVRGLGLLAILERTGSVSTSQLHADASRIGVITPIAVMSSSLRALLRRGLVSVHEVRAKNASGALARTRIWRITAAGVREIEASLDLLSAAVDGPTRDMSSHQVSMAAQRPHARA
jgi:hypothetical protein